MIFLGIWLAASLLLGALWAIAGALLREQVESPSGADPAAAGLEDESEAA